jgi:anti-sigma regulatory factor (Ser/Thr protein kinase)
VPAEPASAAVARRFVGAMIALWDCDDPEQLAVLLTSEVVANAIRHTHRDVRVDVAADAACVRVSTTDDAPELPRLLIVAPGATGGRGLFLVDALASQWGIDANPPGKTVWFELDLGPSPASEVETGAARRSSPRRRPPSSRHGRRPTPGPRPD